MRAAGKYAEALKQHIWIHDHVLEQTPSYYGVRLSFAIGEWLRLGEEYPQALVALKEIRDKKTECLQQAGGQNRNLFHDVRAINEGLDETSRTVALFKHLDLNQPDFASVVYELAEADLVAQQEYCLARKYLGDPTHRFDVAKENFTEGMNYSKESINPDASRRATKRIFVEDVLCLIVLLKATGERSVALKIQSESLKLVSDSAIRAALKMGNDFPGK